MKYLYWNETSVTDFSDGNISEMYEKGYVFTRLGRGIMHQTRSVRIDLSKFTLTSENRRILKKTEGVSLKATALPLTDYDFKIGKLAKDFYDTKFGPGIMSAAKVKEMLTNKEKSNFNSLFEYSYEANSESPNQPKDPASPIGYSICHKSPQILHYSYPFYDLNSILKDMGLGMMIRAIIYAKVANLKYIYLGSLQRPSDTYKLQFEGLEWFDGQDWQTDIEAVKKILTSDKMDE